MQSEIIMSLLLTNNLPYY